MPSLLIIIYSLSSIDALLRHYAGFFCFSFLFILVLPSCISSLHFSYAFLRCLPFSTSAHFSMPRSRVSLRFSFSGQRTLFFSIFFAALLLFLHDGRAFISSFFSSLSLFSSKMPQPDSFADDLRDISGLFLRFRHFISSASPRLIQLRFFRASFLSFWVSLQRPDSFLHFSFLPPPHYYFLFSRLASDIFSFGRQIVMSFLSDRQATQEASVEVWVRSYSTRFSSQRFEIVAPYVKYFFYLFSSNTFTRENEGQCVIASFIRAF